MDGKIVLNYTVDGNDYHSAGEASSNVKKKLKQIGINPEAIRRSVIAMYEGEINMVIHANGGTATVEITPQKIHIILADNGPGIADINLAMKEGYSTASEEARNLGFGAGMGLPNIKKYTDEFEIETEVGKGTTLKMTINC
ncbi:MAG: ATP-binding protein [Clostridia bacterium]|nr:ATP-binding protein [Clostridia bacterium]